MDNRINNLWWYQKTYSNLIEKGKSRGLTRPKDGKYYEKHHILPKCVGGTDEKENLVYLTYREHVIAHRILVELYPSELKLSHALYFMINKSDYSKISSKELEKIRENSIIALRELNLGEKNPMFGKNISEDHKKILSESNKYSRSEETKKRMSLAQLGKKHSDKSKEKMSISHIGLKIHSEERKNFLSKKWSSSGNPNARKVQDPMGNVFNTLKECSEFYGKSGQTIRKWIKTKPHKGFKYLD